MEFSEYVAARRPTLVRSVVLMGCEPHEAEDLVQVALTRCLRSWRRVARAERPDAYVYRTLVNAFRDSRARRCHSRIETIVERRAQHSRNSRSYRSSACRA